MRDQIKPPEQRLPAIGAQVRLWRLARRMTQAELEHKAALSHNAVSRIECGSVSPRVETIERIGRALDISLEQLQFQKPSENFKFWRKKPKYGEATPLAELIAALEKLPQNKRHALINTFMELIRIVSP